MSSQFPSFLEIKQLRAQFEESPKIAQKINSLLVAALNENSESIRKAASRGERHYDFEEPAWLRQELFSLNINDAEFFERLKLHLRLQGYSVLLNVYLDCDGTTSCEMLISW
jgi:hypothetical protein